MSAPGEVMQTLGRAYQYVFVGALEANIRHFENQFYVESNPEKTSFKGRTGKAYSFDFNGVYRHPWARAEVFGECKGYAVGKNLTAEFRTFLAKAYVTSVDHLRHQGDHFWFVTNVPFACSEGSGVRSYDFVRASLLDQGNAEIKEILGSGDVDDRAVWSLVGRLGVFILTDSFLMNTEISYKVGAGETLWSILKKLHGGNAPSGFRSVAQSIASRNRLRSPDHVVSGKRLLLSWHGLRSSGTTVPVKF
jgi:LysM domain-containing protein